ncbi:hypothetical protein [Cyanobium sp. Cruz-8H5]|uniref:hypothetical protein n=1 Tax=Cyanobium sp. Cruz-8H5 TaxID=2823712 RepID=UPI0020CF6FDC|nr:hypothetical protein [Cyanobium sp. Cruz-8H5]MCP9861402.1 type II toxin-antitoxin system MqsR family toxin [Cyanobium sp. Cruz-8H5]
MASRQEVEQFLEAFQTAHQFGRPVKVNSRPKDVQGRADLNMTTDQAVQAVLHLTADNYSKGPERDLDEDDKEIWVFGYVEGHVEVYVKLRLDPHKPFSFPVVRSFHPAERPLKYPLKRSGT